MSTPQLTTDDRRRATAASARLYALAAALCALLLLVALCLMALQHAPWWALLGAQGALLVATGSAAMWLDRGVGRRGDEASRDEDRIGGPFTVTGRARYHLPGLDGRVLRRGEGGPQSTEQVFWIERGVREQEEDS